MGISVSVDGFNVPVKYSEWGSKVENSSPKNDIMPECNQLSIYIDRNQRLYGMRIMKRDALIVKMQQTTANFASEFSATMFALEIEICNIL